MNKKILMLVATIYLLTTTLFGAENRPNILVVMTDQQSATMMSCSGNEWLKTPNLDKLAARGVRFDKAYAANPVCVPSRYSIQTGRYPAEINLRFNEDKYDKDKHNEIVQSAMGHVFRKAGYETFYGGKVHFPCSYDDATSYGYTMLSKDHRDDLAKTSAEFLRNREADDKPFLFFVSFINPHDICYMALRQLMPGSWYDKHAPDELLDALELPEGVTEEEILRKYLPPLPNNFEPTQNEPEGNKQLLQIRKYRQQARDTWGERDWRLHRWAYHRLTELVDSQIGVVLDALENSAVFDNTIVVFTSDHGDMDGAHRLEHKSFFYEESTRIPLIVAGPEIQQGVIENKALVNNGLDILPTLCDLANIEVPNDVEGISFASEYLKESKSNIEKREYLFIENQVGFMIQDDRYKYQYFDQTKDEMLIDLKKDEGEMKNVANEKKYQKVKTKLRNRLFKELNERGIDLSM